MGEARFHGRLMEFMSQWGLSILYTVTFSASSRWCGDGKRKNVTHLCVKLTHLVSRQRGGLLIRKARFHGRDRLYLPGLTCDSAMSSRTTIITPTMLTPIQK